MLFCKTALFTAFFGALFTIRNLLGLYGGEEGGELYIYYFTAYLFLLASSLFSRFLVSFLVSSIEPKALDDFVFFTYVFIFFNLVSVSALDSYRTLDFTGYIFGCLGLVFVYRGEFVRFLVVLTLGFFLYWTILIFGLGQSFDLFGSLPALGFTCFSLYVSRSREAARHDIFEVSQQLEESNKKLQEQMMHDTLTSAYNRTYLNYYLSGELESGRLEKFPLALIVCELNGFSRLNDQFGRHCGDKALSEISTLLAQHLRSTDVLVRYDGEEFVILLPGMDAESARLVADELSQLISLHESDVVRFLFSANFGVTEYYEDDTAENILQRGYRCLAKEKSAEKHQNLLE